MKSTMMSKMDTKMDTKIGTKIWTKIISNSLHAPGVQIKRQGSNQSKSSPGVETKPWSSKSSPKIRNQAPGIEIKPGGWRNQAAAAAAAAAAEAGRLKASDSGSKTQHRFKDSENDSFYK